MTPLPRIEEASGGSRELDRDLAKLIDHAEWAKCANWASMPCGASEEMIDRDALRWLPAYTTSLDAALKLAERVLPGWWIELSTKHLLDEHVSMRWLAEVCHPMLHEVVSYGEVLRSREFYSAHAPTAPLALCAAILKAKEQPQ